MKRALLSWGGWEGHHPEKWKHYAEALLVKEGFAVESSNDLDVFLDAERLRRLDLIVPIWTLGAMTPEQERGLLAAVAQGVGLGGWHGMCAAFNDNLGYKWMTGGQMVAHPGDCIPSYSVRIVDPRNPITEGLRDFTMLETEQYYLHVDPSNVVLATTTFERECEMPVAWIRSWHKGRVFYSSLGHAMKDFEVPEALEILRRGLLWASGKAVAS